MDDTIINKTDIFIVIGIAVACGVFSEFLSWIFVYRNEKFIALNEELKSLYEQVQKEKEDGLLSKISVNNNKKKVKKKATAEEIYTEKTKAMATLKTKSNIITGLIFLSIMPLLFSLFEGLTIAILPFRPIFPFTLITQTGLQGKNIYHCSSTFIYTLILMLTRQNIQKFFGYAPPSGMFGDFKMPEDDADVWK
ncbi:conserved Plasmodium protein, unknown function [Plasmodium berghei]|uniref:Calcium load-activated calcium channel n=2 Tax=Plasmodium berghei TaxID=5821 RepID=A0A509AMP1_PLABA|nr:transmembrane and coiled-coil domain-containing protein 1, putative [Plasmodium berghei ANKA]CXI68294.1 conserved Plasmodium protein, unknown function [Plasmodium berghei]SCM24190.1 conserved Plasmodium protein, unknown function [Plasmodium berghei]SCN26973.1 conserved Plasmodium protein, unknown function [Plasmodium berghei]SCO61417.1 conserved Plasmodium protein, unknown function [Plasmodium berghei]SCO63394.1 conserved Plasmodium protein, unknown function [Plasmodium berghei]|eukprot:XP_034422589.1 transmembrane and coiled-coil domain-containing protein 1, putative [Plasmodium berghei ANKA]